MIVYPINTGYRLALPLVCLLTLLLSSGCQFTPNTKKMRWPWTKEKPVPQPDRVVAVWTDTVLHQTGQAGVRGFGGRVYFYAQDKTDPIEVDGGLAIYVFDADKLQAHDQRPLRKFVFTAEQFATHMSRTSLGPSYSVWLPWGEVGGPPLRLSLITRYEGTASGTTISEPTIKLLPGVPARSIESEQELAEQRSGSSVQLVGHTTPVDTEEQGDQGNEEDVDNPSVPSLNRTSTRMHRVKTIDLPPSFQRHFQRAGGANLGADELPGSEAAGDSATPNNGSTSSNVAPASEPSAKLTTVDSKELQALAAAEAAAPVTTQVIDHRTRMQQRFHGSQLSGTSPLDIREGRWIESLPRIGRQQ
ncbi:MAG: hypothetical protein KDA51_08315 [Planctomycetales bacterium]|nr:hypothetical protein [Planctomycetales bacterium]